MTKRELLEKITIYETPNMGRYRKGKEKIVMIYYKFVGAFSVNALYTKMNTHHLWKACNIKQ